MTCDLTFDLLTLRVFHTKIVHMFEIPDPNLPIHFVTFRALRRILSHVIVKKLRFPIMKATKFNAHAQYHVTCA